MKKVIPISIALISVLALLAKSSLADSTSIAEPNFKYSGYQPGYSVTSYYKDAVGFVRYYKEDVIGDTVFEGKRWLNVEICNSDSLATLCQGRRTFRSYKYESYEPANGIEIRNQLELIDGKRIYSTRTFYLPRDTSYLDEEGEYFETIRHVNTCEYGGNKYTNCRVTIGVSGGIIHTEVTTLKYGQTYTSTTTSAGVEDVKFFIISAYDQIPSSVARVKFSTDLLKRRRSANGRIAPLNEIFAPKY